MRPKFPSPLRRTAAALAAALLPGMALRAPARDLTPAAAVNVMRTA